MADQKFKSKVQLQGGVSLPAETASRAPVIDGSGNLVSSAVTSTELGYISGLTSSAQTQISDAQTDINDHIADAVDAHAATAIANTPAGTITATTVQAAINEIDGDVTAIATDVADLVILSGVAANEPDLGTFTGTIIPDDSTIKAALQALETELEGIPNPFYYAGTWAASTNTPTLDNTDTGVTGAVYYVTDSGTVDFGAGNITFAAGDRVANNGATWDKWDMTDAVASVFSRVGAVTAQAGDYTASQVTNVAAGTIAAITVQAAINELDGDVVAAQGDIDDHIADTLGAHAASAISVIPTGNLTSSQLQSALVELQSDIDSFVSGSAGDIPETYFGAANNQVSAADVVGLAFAAGVVRSFRVLISVAIDATADKYEAFDLFGVNKGSSFDMSVSGVGDDTGVVFTITSAGQVQYTSANSAGFVANSMKFRAETTGV